MDRKGTDREIVSTTAQIAAEVLDIGRRYLHKVDGHFRFRTGNELIKDEQRVIKSGRSLFLLSRETFHGVTSSFTLEALSGNKRLGVQFGYRGRYERTQPYIHLYENGAQLVRADIIHRTNCYFGDIHPKDKAPELARVVEFLNSVVDSIEDDLSTSPLEAASISRTNEMKV